MKPNLTIYTVFYNRGFCLNETVDSLLQYSPDETGIVIVDDFSTDDTAEIARKLERKHSQVHYLKSNSNLGFTKCLQNAINITQKNNPTKYIAIHGSGDLCTDFRFKKQVDYLELNDDFCAVACKHSLLNRADEVVYTSRFSGEVMLNNLESPPKWTHGTIIYRVSAFNEVGGYNPLFKFCQDWDLYVRLLSVGKIFVLNDVAYSKKVFDDGATFNPKKRFEQIKYAEVIRLQLNKNDTERNDTYNFISEYGLDEYLATKESLLLKKSVKSFFTLIITGEYKMALMWLGIFRKNITFGRRLYLEVVAIIIYIIDSNRLTRFFFRRLVLLMRNLF
ncbi:glycosyltransferase family A protein [Pseudoalteromonas sp. AS84]|uniref:glycosyltransferase family 2 protein n=1 Tax=Pseudoalteromonas sp. AS84 TaxID=3135778 RepID=UPI00317200D0